MATRTQILQRGTPLALALPGAQFTELHARVIDAPGDQVWDAYHALRWKELVLTKPLMAVRTAGLGRGMDRRLVDPPSPTAPIFSDPPRCAASGVIGKPWQPRGGQGPTMESLDDLARFDEPGWLKYGMDLVLVPLPGERTFVETTTICEATDASAARRFAAYWAVIRAFSGLVRRDILAALVRRTRTSALAA